MEDTKLEESLDFVDAIDFANGLRPYEEGAKDIIHAIGNGFKKVFGSNAGTAQRNFDDAQRNLQTAQLNQQAAALNAQANQINGQLNQKANPQEANQQEANQQTAQANVPSGSDVAQNIINILQKSFKKAQVTQQKATNAANKEAEKQKKENEKQQKTQPVEGNNGQ